MANKGPVYGLSRECQQKTRAKFDMDLGMEAAMWIQAVTEHEVLPEEGAYEDQFEMQKALKDGVALCDLINAVSPGLIRKVNKGKLPFHQMENIELFLKSCKVYGMNESDTFQTQDLYEGKAMYLVVNTIHALGSLAKKNGFRGPTIGVKFADYNRREFTEEQMNEGKKIINLQYGTNKVASQAGMTPYGSTRHM